MLFNRLFQINHAAGVRHKLVANVVLLDFLFHLLKSLDIKMCSIDQDIH